MLHLASPTLCFLIPRIPFTSFEATACMVVQATAIDSIENHVSYVATRLVSLVLNELTIWMFPEYLHLEIKTKSQKSLMGFVSAHVST
jgi:hypothetical protein